MAQPRVPGRAWPGRGSAARPTGPGRVAPWLCLAFLLSYAQVTSSQVTATCYPSGSGSVPTIPLTGVYVQSAYCQTSASSLCGGISCCGTTPNNCVYGCIYCAVRGTSAELLPAVRLGAALRAQP